jgi:hypothetical protein
MLSEQPLTALLVRTMSRRSQLISVLLTMLCTPVLASDVTCDGVRVESRIEGRVFIWRVTNIDAEPITRFEAPIFASYDYKVPEGWDCDREAEDILVGWAAKHAPGITRGKSAEFSVRASSSGATLTEGSVRLTFADGGTVETGGAWIPQKEAVATRALPAVVITGIVAVHILLRRRHKSASPAD